MTRKSIAGFLKSYITMILFYIASINGVCSATFLHSRISLFLTVFPSIQYNDSSDPSGVT
jgi:hypothetical protein